MDPAESPTTIDLIRHGQPLGGDRFRGQLDDPLSEAGWQDMHAALGDEAPWTAVVSSPLHRCEDFARDRAERLGLPLEIESRFIEISFGDWEGRPHAEVLESAGDQLRAFWADPASHTPPEGEPIGFFQRRVVAAWDDLLREHAGGHVLAVLHAGVIRTILCTVLGIGLDRYYRLEVPKARVSRIRVDDRRGTVAARVMFHGVRL